MTQQLSIDQALARIQRSRLYQSDCYFFKWELRKPVINVIEGLGYPLERINTRLNHRKATYYRIPSWGIENA